MAEIKKFLGLRNNTAGERLLPGQLEVAQNVDIDSANRLLTRLGQTQLAAGSYHSLWSNPSESAAVVMQGQDMYRLAEDRSLTFLTRLQSARPVAYAALNGTAYFSNGTDTGRLARDGNVREWGIRPPQGQPTAAPYAGSLPAGRYQYAMTFVRSDGLESGTGVAGLVELDAPGGILFSQLEISTNPEVSGKMLYVSAANGKELYRIALLPANAASYAHMNGTSDLGASLETQFVEPAPAGELVEIHAGRAYVVDGNVVWYSDPYSLERFRRGDNFLQFPDRVTMFAAVDDGVFVSTHSGVWFLAGYDPADMKSAELILGYGAIQGSAVKFEAGEETAGDSADRKAEQPTRPAVMFTTPRGIVIGYSGGAIRNATEENYSFPDAQRGAGLLRLTRGYIQYVATLQGTGVAQNAYQ
jgi:hypothetical protein